MEQCLTFVTVSIAKFMSVFIDRSFYAMILMRYCTKLFPFSIINPYISLAFTSHLVNVARIISRRHSIELRWHTAFRQCFSLRRQHPLQTNECN